jgi:hypothetical protein
MDGSAEHDMRSRVAQKKSPAEALLRPGRGFVLNVVEGATGNIQPFSTVEGSYSWFHSALIWINSAAPIP